MPYCNSLGSRRVGIQISNTYSNQVTQPLLYKIFSITFVLLAINFSTFIFQLLAFYSYFVKRKNTWTCLLITFGAFQTGKIKNHHQYYRFFTSMILHNSIAHLGSNSLSLVFLGFRSENEINNKMYYIILYIISGLTGNFLLIIFNQINISVGSSGAIMGLFANFMIFFLLNFRRMNQIKKYSCGILFIFLFINLFSGLFEGGENINMICHIGGFLGGFSFSFIIAYKNNVQLQINNKLAKNLYYCCYSFLVLLTLISLGILAYKNVLDSTDYICRYSL